MSVDMNDKAAACGKANHFTIHHAAQLREILETEGADYQKNWFRNRSHRTRMVVKSRLIGATYYFALEALITAIETGHNQRFIGCSERHSQEYRIYIKKFSERVGVELRGDPLIITSDMVDGGKTDIALHFLLPAPELKSAPVVEEDEGDVYLDEFFWIENFSALNKSAEELSLNPKYSRTYVSSMPEFINDAYIYWAGERIDTSHAALKWGKMCKDKIWRQVVTVEDAVEGGLDWLDPDELRCDYTPDEFSRLFMCEFPASRAKGGRNER